MEYPNNLDCVHEVPIPHGMALKITFKDFLLEDPFWIGYWFVDKSCQHCLNERTLFFWNIRPRLKTSRRTNASCNLGQPKLSLIQVRLFSQN